MKFNFIEVVLKEHQEDLSSQFYISRTDFISFLVKDKKGVSLIKNEEEFYSYFKTLKTGTIFFSYNLNITAVFFFKILKNLKNLKLDFILTKNSFYLLSITLDGKLFLFKNFLKFFPENLKFLQEKFIPFDLINNKKNKTLMSLTKIDLKENFNILDKKLDNLAIMEISLEFLREELKKFNITNFTYINSMSKISLDFFKNLKKRDYSEVLTQKNSNYGLFKPLYFGGRNEVIGNPYNKEFISYLDYNLMYAQVMEDSFFYGDFQEKEINYIDGQGIYYAKVEENTDIPYLPFKNPKDGEIYYVNGIRLGLFFFDDLKTVESLGGKILEVYKKYEFSKESKAFREFSLVCQENRKTSLFANYFYKKIITNFYGRLGMPPYGNSNILVNIDDYHEYREKNWEEINSEIWIDDWAIIEKIETLEKLEFEDILNLEKVKNSPLRLELKIIYDLKSTEHGNKLFLIQEIKAKKFNQENNRYWNLLNNLFTKLKKCDLILEMSINNGELLTATGEVQIEDYSLRWNISGKESTKKIGYITILEKKKIELELKFVWDESINIQKGINLCTFLTCFVEKKKLSSNVLLAAQITAKARKKLFEGLKVIKSFNGRLLYWDTDSYFIAFKKKKNKLECEKFFKENFEIKVSENVITEALFVSTKFYALKFENGEEVIKISGIIEKNISFWDFKENYKKDMDFLKLETLKTGNSFQTFNTLSRALFFINLKNSYKKRIFSYLKHETIAKSIIFYSITRQSELEFE